MSIRLRLSLWYTALLGAILVFFGLVVYFNMVEQSQSGLDNSLSETARHMAEGIRSGAVATSSRHNPSVLTVDEFAAPGVFVQVIDVQGHPLARSSNLHGQSLPVDWEAMERGLMGRPSFRVVTVHEESVRVYSLPTQAQDGAELVVQVGASLHHLELSLSRLRLLLVLGGAGALAIAGVTGWAMASGALRPIAELTWTAQAIALSREFGRRLPAPRSADEVGQLVVAFNEMLESLQEAYATQNRFVADASHELRAPLATIQGNLELLERAPAMSPEERAEALADAGSEIRRLSRLVADLLTLARADAGQTMEVKRVDLGAVVLDSCRLAMVRARGLELVVGHIERLAVEGDEDRLKQLVLILLDNAIKYTPRGRVTVSLAKEGNAACVKVSDTGIGITLDDIPHIFERFYRADKARGRDEGGSGLGLSIAQWIAHEHGGDIAVVSAPGQGSVFSVLLPLAPQVH